MEFKTTKDFFKKVRFKNICEIDIENYIYKVTNNYNIDKLKLLFNDLEIYLCIEQDKMEVIPSDEYFAKINYYNDNNIKIPKKSIKNYSKLLKQKKGLDVSNEPDFIEYLDLETIFYPYEFFTLYQLKKKIFDIYKKQTTAPEPTRTDLNKVEVLINEPPTATAPEPQQNNNFTFENNFDEVKSDFVYNYFKENLVDKKYITIKVLEDFLVMAFQEKKQPENKFVFEKHTQSKMKKVFYDYYKVINQNSYGKKPEYVNLLCNYFIGYDAKKVGANFNK